MKKQFVRTYPVEHDGTESGITHLKVMLYHSTGAGFCINILPIQRENGLESVVLSIRTPAPSMYIMAGRYTEKRYQLIKGNLDSIISSLFESWTDNPYEINSCIYTQEEKTDN